jgi:outer membrane receptor for ferrienterochelin and colicin
LKTITLSATKELPRLSRTFDQKQHFSEPFPSYARFGIRMEVEAGYGIDDTFVGRLQHGAQLRNVHYALTGHWETTQNASPDRQEENLTTHMKCDIDVTDASKILLDGGYLQSHVALPQLSYEASHKKSAIQARIGYQVDFDPTFNASVLASWEDARFTDQYDLESTFRKYGGHLTLRKNWSGKNSLSLDATGGWEELSQEQSNTRDNDDTMRYYGSALFLNSFATYDRFSLDTGIRLDYYESKQESHTDYHIAPVVTGRLHLFQTLSWYVTYHPRLKFPDFTDLYIRKMYATVNPELYPEKQRNYVEIGFKQRIGETFAVNVGGFYHDSDGFIFQIDADADNILEYANMKSVDFLGVRANLQMNYRERLAQNITYTYTTHHIFSEQRVSLMGDDFRNIILPYRPNHQVQASLSWKLPFGLTVDLDGIYVSEQYRNRAKVEPQIGRRFFVNVELTQRITENLSVFLAGRNVTDTSTYDIIPWLDSEEITSSRLFLGGIRFRF